MESKIIWVSPDKNYCKPALTDMDWKGNASGLPFIKVYFYNYESKVVPISEIVPYSEENYAKLQEVTNLVYEKRQKLHQAKTEIDKFMGECRKDGDKGAYSQS